MTDKTDININGRIFSLVKLRSHTPVSVYKGAEGYLRIGPKELIEKEIELHKTLIRFGFPVAEILKEGELGGQAYFTERSLGERHFGEIFHKRFVKDGTIPAGAFERFLALVKVYAAAQLKSATGPGPRAEDEFRELIHFPLILSELPRIAKKSRAAMKKAEEHLADLPVVITHGDFNAHNILERGVIDWERGAYAPAGYDLAEALTQPFFFPVAGHFEMLTDYRFSETQGEKYWSETDAFYQENGLPPVSRFRDDFIFCRSVWSAVRMERFPKLQAWRYRLHELLTDAYLEGENLMTILQNYE